MITETLRKLNRLDEPELSFGHDQHTAFSKDGLLWFGPVDYVQKPGILRIGLVASQQGTALYKKWVREINLPIDGEGKQHHIPFPGFEAVFGVAWPETPVCSIIIPEAEILSTIRIKDRHQAIYNSVTLYEEKIRQYINEEDTAVDVWFVVIPEEVYKYGRPKSRVPGMLAESSPVHMNAKVARQLKVMPSLFEEDNQAAEIYGYDLHFHNQLKARLLNAKAVVQVVRETTLSPESFMDNGRPTRKLQDKASVAWNLCTTTYFKAAGPPWRLAGVREGVCYVGLVFKIDESNKDPSNACCGAQMFLDSGDGVVFRGAVGPWYNTESKQFHLPKDKAKEIVDQVVKSYSQKHGFPPKELFIHGTTAINEDEWQGFCEAAPNETKVIAIQIRNENRFKLYSSGDNPIVRGAWLQTQKNKGYLWTKGFVPRLGTYQGREVPNPLSISITKGQAELSQVMQDIMGLTKLNFNRCDFADGKPVTLRFADHVGEILTATPMAHDLPPLPFKHYI
jgi:hypothetical protein